MYQEIDKGTFDPIVVEKGQKDISSIEEKNNQNVRKRIFKSKYI